MCKAHTETHFFFLFRQISVCNSCHSFERPIIKNIYQNVKLSGMVCYDFWYQFVKQCLQKLWKTKQKIPLRIHGKSQKNLAKNDQTHPSLNLHCFHIVSATDFIQTLNKTEDFEVLIFIRFGYLLPFFKYYSFTFMPFLFLFRFYNGCVLRNLQETRVGDVIARVKKR